MTVVSIEQHEAWKLLQRIPNVGPATAQDLLRLGIASFDDLVNQDPDEMYERLCCLDGTKHDPCVRDVFAAAVAYALGKPARPWWEFSRERKARERQSRSK